MAKKRTPLPLALLGRAICPDDSFDRVQAKLKTDRAEYIRENDGQASLEELFNMYHNMEEEDE